MGCVNIYAADIVMKQWYSHLHAWLFLYFEVRIYTILYAQYIYWRQWYDNQFDYLQERRKEAEHHMTEMEEEMKKAEEQLRARKEEADRASVSVRK